MNRIVSRPLSSPLQSTQHEDTVNLAIHAHFLDGTGHSLSMPCEGTYWIDFFSVPAGRRERLVDHLVPR
jgi:hypothetical protein